MGGVNLLGVCVAGEGDCERKISGAWVGDNTGDINGDPGLI